ncbi:beta-aspartyl-peptidase [Bermanella marisrubri]|uniref:Isoaspartyl dipeptidase n=1 Tax=Bermanella marisrubri TaxID=207949 RepID=Q1MXW1_9GAMM|nr:beta-aspartyl-peptidase [Bermanella marisrubri]EAT10817.1 isoaspartyl dipeptidase [Oceanobacter sp. RED65] [Bermanella marisrubri]
MFTLIKNSEVYAPHYLGKCDVLIADGRIAYIDSEIDFAMGELIDVVDANGKILTPGFVDSLVHITGGGGEGGFNTRTPELDFFDAVNAGVTSMVGALGTDATTRTLGDLFGKTQALNADGLNCFMYTGSYEIPVKNISGSLRDDIIFIDPVIGVGEIAIADKRGSQPTTHELARIAADARVGGLLSGKSGIVMIHTGASETYLDILHETCRDYDVGINQFYPTHINRTLSLLQAGAEFTKQGGTIDLTASTNDHLIRTGDIPAGEGLAKLLNMGVSPDKITFSSDAQGSLPHFDANGRLDGLDIGSISSLHFEMVRAVKDYDITLDKSLACITRNPAKVLGLKQKGEVKKGFDADLCLLDRDSLAVNSVMSRGKWLKLNNKIVGKTAFSH